MFGWGGGGLGGSELDFGWSALGLREGSGLLGDIDRRQRISSYRPSEGEVLQITLTLEASSVMTDFCLSSAIVSC